MATFLTIFKIYHSVCTISNQFNNEIFHKLTEKFIYEKNKITYDIFYGSHVCLSLAIFL